MTAAYQSAPAMSPVCSLGDASLRQDETDRLPADFDRSKYLSAQEIADLRLKGLPTTKQGVNRAANAESWPFIDRPGRGGGRLYPITALPTEAAFDLARRRIEEGEGWFAARGRPKGTDRLTNDKALADAIMVILSERPTSARNLAKALMAMEITPPPLRTLQRFIARIEDEQKVLLASVRNPDEYRSKYRLSLGSADGAIAYAHEVWEIDTTKADIMLMEGRKCVLGIIDRYSRRARFELVDSESAQSVRRMLINTIRAWGVMPSRLKVDHGSGFMNASIQTALELLDITLDPCLPGNPQDKPFVERLFGTFNRDRAPLLKGFIGHNVAQAQELRARARGKTGKAIVAPEITAAEFQQIMDNWLDGEYHLRTHSRLRMSPMEKWQASPPGARRAPPEDALKLALSAFVTVATVTKRGVRWKNGRYWSPALSAWMGRQVQVRRDEDDLGALFIFDEDGRYIDTAINHERAGVTEQQFALHMRRRQEQHMADARADLREKSRQYNVDEAVRGILRSEAELAGKLTHLPPAHSPASTPMLDSVAGEIAPSPENAGRGADIIQLPTASPAMTPFERVEHTDRLLAAAERGEAVDPDALRAAQIHATSNSYFSTKVVNGDLTYAEVQELRRQRGQGRA